MPAWIVCELIATKLPHYVLPLYPAIAVACAAALASGRIDVERRWVRLLFGLGAAGPILTVVGMTVAFVVLEGNLPPVLAPLGVVLAAVTALALRLVRARALLGAWLLTAVLGAPLLYFSVFGVLAPRLENLWLSPRLALAAGEVRRCADPKVISVGNREASLIFSVGTDIPFGTGAEASAFLQGDGCRVAIVERQAEPEFVAGLAARGLRAEPARRVKGINIANGRRLDFGVYGAPR